MLLMNTFYMLNALTFLIQEITNDSICPNSVDVSRWESDTPYAVDNTDLLLLLEAASLFQCSVYFHQSSPSDVL